MKIPGIQGICAVVSLKYVPPQTPALSFVGYVKVFLPAAAESVVRGGVSDGRGKRPYSFLSFSSSFSRIGNEEFSPDESCTTVGALDARPDPSLSELSSSLSHVDLFRRGHRATSSSSSRAQYV